VKILTAAQMQRIDRLTTERLGIPGLTLMENAGQRVSEYLAEHFAPLDHHRIAILCGRGNNGGDGFVVARLLRGLGCGPRVVLFADPAKMRGDAAADLERYRNYWPVSVIQTVEEWEKLKPEMVDTTLLIDAMLGTGLTKPLEGLLLKVVRDLNSALPASRVVAIDVPTGLSADSGHLIGESLRADACVTFTAPKYAHVFPPACEHVGQWVVRGIGTPDELMESDPELLLDLTRVEDVKWVNHPRPLESHKGLFGHVLVIAGSVGKTGAAVMAAKAALRAGAGLVTIATPRSALSTVACQGMEFMTEPLPETDTGTVSLKAFEGDTLQKIFEGKTVLAVGPGLGSQPETVEYVRKLMDEVELPVVLDADGLNAFAGHAELIDSRGRVRILTPHPGEMSRLTGTATKELLERRIDVAREFAVDHEVVLVLKGSRTLIAAPGGRVAVNPTGNPGMATGGTGDCLTGLMAGLLAQYRTRPAEQVAAAAVFLHGLAGDVAAERQGQASMIAGDLLEAIPEAFRRLAS
jgi:ADP-dependent NAD(P)H-hydrate dehydratase / NAD(P)H-hydrate epimerase